MNLFRVISVIFLAGWMILIFSFSAQNASESSETSGGCIKKVVQVVYPGYKELEKDKQEELVNSFQFTTRKTAHFSLYAVLGILSFCSVITYWQLLLRYRVIVASGICLMYAVSDEVHQEFVPGRSCEIRDICIDYCGSILAISLCLLVLYKSTLIKRAVRWLGNGKQQEV